MAFKVFLSYSLDPAEQALAWRLQTLATAHGIEMFVPRHGLVRTGQPERSWRAVQNAIDRADCVLAIITARASPNVQKELQYALSKKGKLVIPIVHSDLAGGAFARQFPRIFFFSPWDPAGKVEAEIAQFLKQRKTDKEKQQAIGALAALGIGLLLLFALSEK